MTNNYIADENGFRSSLAPSNGPPAPLVGKLPKVPLAAVAPAPAVQIASPAIHVAAPAPAVAVAAPIPAQPAIYKVEKPAVVKYSGAHVAPGSPQIHSLIMT